MGEMQDMRLTMQDELTTGECWWRSELRGRLYVLSADRQGLSRTWRHRQVWRRYDVNIHYE